MTEITTDDINVVLSTVVGLFPGEDADANNQKLMVTTMALIALCHSFEIELEQLVQQVEAAYHQMGEIPTRPLLDPSKLKS